MSAATDEILSFDGIDYRLRIPKNAETRINKLRIFVNIHGTHGDADTYMGYPLEQNDDDRYNLILIAPKFPDDPHPDVKTWYKYNKIYVQWLYDLIHCEMPGKILPERGLGAVYTKKMYIFGHSQGGQFVRSYMMKFYSVDIIRAASCAGGNYETKNALDSNMTDTDYKLRLKKLVASNLAIIVGSSDCAAAHCLTHSTNGLVWDNNYCIGGWADGDDLWRRQKAAISYFSNHLLYYLGHQYMKCIVTQPPDWHPIGASFEWNRKASVRPFWNKKIRHIWTANPLENGQVVQGHWGWRNYQTARKYLFESRSLCCPLSFFETLLSRLFIFSKGS